LRFKGRDKAEIDKAETLTVKS